MAALVADYGSSSSSSDDSDLEEPDQSEQVDTKQKSEKPEQERLPLPSFTSELLPGTSIFANPYRQEEDARRAVLEKHVKLTTAPTELRQINGKQVCWNYRKGRCRFGRNCKFAHDSDLQRDEAEDAENPPAGADVPPGAESVNATRSAPMGDGDGQPPRKKRPGLCQTLVPGKKVMRMYKGTQKGPLV